MSEKKSSLILVGWTLSDMHYIRMEMQCHSSGLTTTLHTLAVNCKPHQHKHACFCFYCHDEWPSLL